MKVLTQLLSLGLTLVFISVKLFAQEPTIYLYSDRNTETIPITSKGKFYKKTYFSNGQMKAEGWIENGRKNYFWISYFENGNKKSEGHYLNDTKRDWWVFYNEIGQKTNEGHYTAQVKTGFHHIYEDGKPIYAGHFVNDIKKGTWVTLNRKGDFIDLIEYGE
jgi:hypothetical protein